MVAKAGVENKRRVASRASLMSSVLLMGSIRELTQQTSVNYRRSFSLGPELSSRPALPHSATLPNEPAVLTILPHLPEFCKRSKFGCEFLFLIPSQEHARPVPSTFNGLRLQIASQNFILQNLNGSNGADYRQTAKRPETVSQASMVPEETAAMELWTSMAISRRLRKTIQTHQYARKRPANTKPVHVIADTTAAIFARMGVVAATSHFCTV